MAWKPEVGQKVRLNSKGYKSLQLDSGEAFEQSKCMTITRVTNVGYRRAPVWVLRVDQPLIDRFLLDSRFMEPIPKEG